ncbi:MAG: bifunctional phosphopantothenoylcysteine decarboxylase/phosphopantothenate--cysteine ligase CoaBC [Gammaproteobacteria bacterium]|nr:bifunctional phosphopantothenoylcysteine decarboxylase/phosphopantothenate--cysteine ligase CoaBC [Gammaproteobacteria bacterium]MDD9897245.1 bifunctional phosphopantothenoylcysteine decarboxylase/phosphopantothenate--cysteine ligase CoaBC [Gammaproteobacteria bacterium]
MLSLTNKRILLGITGGIAAYKCAELTRLFAKAGAEVRVAMTQAATEFITPLTMQALSGNRVSLDLLDTEAEAAMGHIELARWADLVLVAPATADFIARVTHGQADDILSTLVLATNAPIALAPAMNQAMWADTGTQSNLHSLRERGFHIFGPGEGAQACGDIGLGRMLEPEQLIEHSAALFEVGELAGLRFVITGGPTREAIDPVRFITNHSSGKMAYALAQEAAAAGAQVTLISGRVNLSAPETVRTLDVESAEDMLTAVMENISDASVFIGVAAVADYRPRLQAEEKIKKDGENLTLELVKNPDIISEVAKLEPKPFVVGFAAETNSIVENGKEKLDKKNLDLLFANNATETFNSDSISVTAITPDNEFELATANKNVVAREMLKLIAEKVKG